MGRTRYLLIALYLGALGVIIGNALHEPETGGMTVESLNGAAVAAAGVSDNALNPPPLPTVSTPYPTASGQLYQPTAVAVANGPITPQTIVIVPPPATINNYSVDAVVSLPDHVANRIRAIYAVGLSKGNNPRAFSKIGDCNSEAPFFLARFDDPAPNAYNLGNFSYLEPTIDYFQGSFSRQGMAVWRGNHAWQVISAMWADASLCQPNESPMACEFRLNRPSVVLIRLGTNEYSSPPEKFEGALRQILDSAIAAGVIPVLGTKADRLEGSDANNEVVRRLAAEYALPLWDFGMISETLPNRGLVDDGFHMNTFYQHDYRQPEAFTKGHSVQNLTALIALDKVLRVVTASA